MSDLISREKAIDYFVTNIGVVDADGYAVDDYDERVKIWTERFSGIPSVEPERKWIPVTEALPINDVDVIVSVLDDSGDTPYRFTSVGWCTPNGQYWVVDNEMCYGVIAWMPLVEPWRGE